MSSNPLDHSSKSGDGSTNTLERRLDIVVTQGASGADGSFLLVVSGEQSGKLFPLNKPKLIIGRSPNADIRINEKAVSHKHAGVSMDGQHYAIRDLGSTNGTLVNGEVVTNAVDLQGGDTISIGSTTLTFLSREDQGKMDRTVQLQGGTRPAAEMGYIESMREQPSLPPGPYAPAQQYPVSMAHHSGDDSMSLTDVLRKINTYWLYTKRYGWLVATCTCFGVAAGILQTRLSPPPGSAWFEVILSSRGAATDDDESRTGVPIFLSPDSTFRSLPLIKKTWKELTDKVPSDEFSTALQRDLTFEQAGYQSPLWRGEYKSGTSARAVEFLTKHLNVYLNNEIDKKLNLIRSHLKVLLRQKDEAQKTMDSAIAKLYEFAAKYPNAVPQGALLPTGLKDALSKANSTIGQLATVRRNIELVKRELNFDRADKAKGLEESLPHRRDAERLQREMDEKRLQKYRDQHPEMIRLKAAYKAARRREQNALKAGQTKREADINGQRAALQAKLQSLESKRRTLEALQGKARKDIVNVQITKDSLPALRAQYQRLDGTHKTSATNYNDLLGKFRTTTLELENARALGKNQYDITTPPTGMKPSIVKATVKRAGLGGFVGLFLAILAAGILELRARILARRPR